MVAFVYIGSPCCAGFAGLPPAWRPRRRRPSWLAWLRRVVARPQAWSEAVGVVLGLVLSVVVRWGLPVAGGVLAWIAGGGR